MKDFMLYTKFNFAKCVHLSLIAVPEGNLCSSPEGISDFIKPYLQELQERTNHSRLLNSSINPNYRKRRSRSYTRHQTI